MLYATQNGQSVLSSSPLRSEDERSIYLLNWEDTLPGETVLKKESISAEILINSLPYLSLVKKVHEKA